MFHVIQVHGIAIKEFGLFLSHNDSGGFLGKKDCRITGPCVIVYHHLDGRVYGRNLGYQRLAALIIKGFSIPRVGGQRIVKIKKIDVCIYHIGVDNPCREHIRNRTREIQDSNTFIDLTKKADNFSIIFHTTYGGSIIQGIEIVICLDIHHTLGRHNHKNRKSVLILDKVGLKDGPRHKIGTPRTHIHMIGGPGFTPCIAHPKRFYRAINLTVEMDLPNITVVGMDDDICVIRLSKSIKGSQFGFNGDPCIDGGNSQGLAFKVFIQIVGLYIFFGFSKTHTKTCSQPDFLGFGLAYYHISYGSKHLGIGFASQKSKPVMGGQNIYLVPRSDL